ncbi:substrate-binding periplasmic protein [Arsukibacterium sp.]|uniref:substrate-binding periplasmic protein n=1 Tax=Arsukibacterium sp. TaxID=1977258 RepID=UPI00356A03BB
MRRCTRLVAMYSAALLLLSIGALAEPEAPCQLTVRVESEQQHSAAGSFNETQVSQQFNMLLSTLVSKINCTLQFVDLPAGRAMKMLEDGQLDIMVGMSETEDRARYSYFIGPHHTERMVVVASQRVPDTVQSLQQLVELNGAISVADGGYYGPLWQQLLDDNPALLSRIFAAAGNQQKLAMLVSGRVMASLEDEATVDELLEQNDLQHTYRKLFVIHENPVYFAFSRKTIDNIVYKQLQDAWQLMLSSGEVSQIKLQIPLAQPRKTDPAVSVASTRHHTYQSF